MLLKEFEMTAGPNIVKVSLIDFEERVYDLSLTRERSYERLYCYSVFMAQRWHIVQVFVERACSRERLWYCSELFSIFVVVISWEAGYVGQCNILHVLMDG